LEPSVASSDNFVWIGFPYKWPGVIGVVFLDEAVDCGLQIDQRIEHAMLKPAAGQFGEKALDCIQPRA
jgi:hypothetical protein